MLSEFRLGSWLIQPSLNTIKGNGTSIRLEPKVLSVLVQLAERQGEVVSKEELMRAVWADACVTDDTLTRCIYELRKVLEDDVKEPRFIQTIPRRGYRLISPVDFERAPVAPSNGKQAGREIFEGANPASTSKETKRANGRPRLGRQLYALAALLGLLIFALLLIRWIDRRDSGHQRALTRVTFDAGLQTGASWSPDGRFIAYSSNRGGKFDVWVQPINGGDPVQVTHEPGQNWQAEWSPNGKYIAYRSENGDGGLYIVPALGGTRRKLADFGYYPRWSPDSSQILFLPTIYGGVRSLYAVSLEDGQPHQVLADFFTKHPELTGRSAAWHPDGKRVSVCTWDYQRMAPIFWTVPLDRGETLKTEVDPEVLKQLGDTGSARFVVDTSFSWSPAGNAIYLERTFNGATNLWKMAVDPKTLRATGIERLTTGPGADTGVAITSDGKKLAFSGESRQIQIWVAPFDARSGQLTGKGEPLSPPGIEAWLPSLTADGKELAFSGNRGRNWQIWNRSIVSGDLTPISDDDVYTRLHPLWSPDGTRLAYLRIKLHGSENKIVTWSRASKEEQVIADAGGYDIYGWSRDGRELVLSKWSENTNKAEIWLLSLSTGSCTGKIAASPDYHLFQGQFSPDGQWVAFQAVRDVPNGREAIIYVVPARGGQWIRVTDGRQWDDKPRWSPDGKTLYFVSGRGGLYNVWGNHFDPRNGTVVGAPFRVSAFDNPALMVPIYIPQVGLSVAEGRIAVTVSQSSGSIWMLNNVDE